MALTKSEIIELYTATFNRAADADGVAYWLTQELTQTEMANAFIASTEAAALYPSTQTNTEYVEAIYANLFGHAADAAGLAYWVGELDAGTTAKESMVVAVVNGALGDDQTTLDNRTTISTQYVDGNSNATDVSLASVTADAATVTAAAATATTAVQAIADAAAAAAAEAAAAEAAAAVVGSTIVFTTGIDALTGTDKNDTFVGDAGTGTPTVVNADQVAGGAGTDTAKLYNVDGPEDLPTMDSIENLILINSTNTGSDTDVSTTGATSVTIEDGTDTKDWTVASTQTVTVSKTINGENIGLDFGATASEVNVVVDAFGTNAATTGSATLDIIGAVIKTVNINATGKASDVVLDNAAVDGFTTLVVTGDVATDIDASAMTALTSVTASAMTVGGLTLDVSGVNTGTQKLAITGSAQDDSVVATGASLLTATLGAGNDFINVAANLTASDSIDAGEGTDTIGMTAAMAGNMDDKTDAHNLIQSKVSSFEQLRITDDMNGTTTDISAFGVNYLQIGAEVTVADATINGFTSGATVELRDVADVVAGATAGYVIGMTGATAAGTPDDVLNINLNANIVTASAVDFDIAAAGVNTYNINATDQDGGTTANVNGAGGYVFTAATVTAGADASLNTVNITGDAAVNYVVSATADALATIDASASTGVLILDAGTSFDGTQGVTIKGGSRADTITGSANADNITSGEGADILSLTGSDVVTDFAGGAAGDIIDLSVAGNSVGVNLIADADATAKVIASTSTAAQATVTGDTVFVSVETASKFDTIAEIGALFATGKAFAAAANTAELTVMIAAADTGNTYVYDVTEVGSNGLSTGADTATLVATLNGVTATDLDGFVAANFQA